MDKIPANTDSPIDRLREISTWVSSVQDLDKLLELIIETATRMMDAKASSLLLLDRKAMLKNSKSISVKALPDMLPKQEKHS